MTQTDLQVDIVSDVVCPWCIVGFLQLDRALTTLELSATVRWHPFELNPDMAPEGEHLREHMMRKYGVTREQSMQARQRLTDIGPSLNFNFHFDENARIVNTFRAHQLLDWAEHFHLQHPLKLTFFRAYFCDGRDVSDIDTLLSCVGEVGLDVNAAREMLEQGSLANQTRQKMAFWTSRGITGVPAMIFDRKYLLTGAQGVEGYQEILKRCRAEAA